MSILVGAVPMQVAESAAASVKVNCYETIVTKDSTASDVGILFPKKAASEKKLPLVGGAVVKIGIGNNNIQTSRGSGDTDNWSSQIEEIKSEFSIVKSRADEIGDSPNLDDLTSVRNKINKCLFSLSKKGLTSPKVVSILKEVPRVFISLYYGDEETLKETGINHSVLRFAELTFIPMDVFGTISDSLKDKLGESYGVSGKSFGKISEDYFGTDGEIDDAKVSDDMIVDCLLEFAPIYNLPEEQINSSKFSPDTGGFFTIANSGDDFLYIKMPDLTGRDSSGFTSDLFSEDDPPKILIEMVFKDNTLRTSLDYQPPPALEIMESEYSLPTKPDSSNVEVLLNGQFNNSSNAKVYLSVMAAANTSRISGFKKTQGNMAEIFSAPMLTKTIRKDTGDPIFGKDDAEAIGLKIGELAAFPDNIFNIFRSSESSGAVEVLKDSSEKPIKLKLGELEFDLEDLGFPLTNSSQNTGNISSYLGEMNRPDIIISNRDVNASSGFAKNDERFANPKVYGVKDLMASHRPTFIDLDDPQVPPEPFWIEGEISYNSESEEAIATFKSTKFSDIYFPGDDTGSAEYLFSLYIIDNLGQMVRVPGPNIRLTVADPSISEIKPNGYYEGGSVIASDSAPQIRVASTDGELDDVYAFRIYDDSDNMLLEIKQGVPGILQYESWVASISTAVTAQFDLDLETLGVSSGYHNLSAVNVYGAESTKVPFFVATPGTDKSDLPVLGTADLQSFFEDPKLLKIPGISKTNKEGVSEASGIPVPLDGQSSKLKLKYKKAVFKKNSGVCCYIAFSEKENAQIFGSESDIVTVNTRDEPSLTLYIAKNLRYTLDEGSDFTRLSNKKAQLMFPGTSFAKYNWKPIIDMEGVYIFLSSKEIDEVTPQVDGETTSLTSSISSDTWATSYSEKAKGSYAYVKISKSSDPDNILPAFIGPPTITNMILGDRSGKNNVAEQKIIRTSSAIYSKSLESLLPDYGFKEFDIVSNSKHSAVGKIQASVLVFEAHNFKAKHKFKFGTKKINSKRVGKLKYLSTDEEPGRIVAGFKNVSATQDGYVSFSVSSKYKKFKVTLESSNLNVGLTTTDVPSESYSIDPETQSLWLSKEWAFDTGAAINTGAAFIGEKSLWETPDQNTVGSSEIMIGEGRGLMVTSDSALEAATNGDYVTQIPVSITPTTFDFDMRSGSISDGEASSSSFMLYKTTSDIGRISRVGKDSVPSSISIPSGTEVSSSAYSISGDSASAKLFLKAQIGNYAAVEYNIPNIIKIERINPSETYEEGEFENLTFEAKEKLFIYVKNAKRYASITINDIRCRVISRRMGADGVLKAKVVVPKALALIGLGSSDCFVIGASNSNAERNRVRALLGDGFVLDIEQMFEDLILGPLKDKLGDIEDLLNKLLEAPLQFINLLMDKLAALKGVIQNFCDISFHLTAELKVQLRGFQVLLIPIQVIFCIIDVICSLLNPFKLAKSIIRLFQCLFDLILLLPQLSVPVMFLRLLLHLLDLLECLIQKILAIIYAINEIIKAIDRAIKYKNWPAIKALEEVLSEYLFSVEADLEVLEPIITILAIFLQLLQMFFRFPCEITPGTGDAECGIDGTILAGILGGKLAPGGSILPDIALPVAQHISVEEISEIKIDDEPYGGADSGGTDVINVSDSGYNVTLAEKNFEADEVVEADDPYEREEGALLSEVGLMIEAMGFVKDGEGEDAPDTLRIHSVYGSPSGESAQLGKKNFGTFEVSYTKSKKGFALFKSNPQAVSFKFNAKGRTTFEFPFFRKSFEPDQTLDSPLYLLDGSESTLKIRGSGERGTFVSPIDGHDDFITVSSDGETASVRSLILPIDFPIYEVNTDTGELELIETRTEYKTFDGIPRMAIMDHEFNLYYIEEDGIIFGEDPHTGAENVVVEIKAVMQNHPSAPKHASSRERVVTVSEIGLEWLFQDEGGSFWKSDIPSGLFGGDAGKISSLATFVECQDGNRYFDGLVNSSGWPKGEDEEDTATYGIPEAPRVGNRDHVVAVTDEVVEKFVAIKDEDNISVIPGKALESFPVLDFPQLYFVDVRQAHEEIQQMCTNATINQSAIPSEEDTESVKEMIQEAIDCVEKYPATIKAATTEIRLGMAQYPETKVLPGQINVDDIVAAGVELQECVEDIADRMCIQVVNELSTSFKVREDDDTETPVPGYSTLLTPAEIIAGPGVVGDAPDEYGPRYIGAREYASGDGDSGIIEIGEIANIEIIPRECYGNPAPGNFTKKIEIEIISDDTGSAEILLYDEDDSNSRILDQRPSYFARITAGSPGEVKIKATICDKTIEALAFSGFEDVVEELSAASAEVDCIEDPEGEGLIAEGIETPLGGLTRVDRVLSIFFVDAGASSTLLSNASGNEDDDAMSAKSKPQTFGTKLEN